MYNNYNFNNYNNGFKTDTSYYSSDLAAYISKVFAWMFAGLMLTGLTALYCVSSETMRWIYRPGVFMLLALAQIIMVMSLSARIHKMNFNTAVLVFMAYAVLNGLTLSSIFLVYTASSISYAFTVTALAFGIMSIYGYVTKTDLTRFGPMLFMGLTGIIILSIFGMFIPLSGVERFISIAGLFVFLGLTAYDTQRIKEFYYYTAGDIEASRKSAILGALKLYLDFINLFLIILRFSGRRR